jgi:hypothetical protein
LLTDPVLTGGVTHCVDDSDDLAGVRFVDTDEALARATFASESLQYSHDPVLSEQRQSCL